MQITHQADYATRAILYLARVPKDQVIATNEIAKKQNIPLSFLVKIIGQLSIAGLLHTSRGAGGGVKLARKPEEITLLEVIEVIDGPVQLNVCVGREHVCSFEGNCPLQSVWCNAQNELITKLRNTNFAELIA